MDFVTVLLIAAALGADAFSLSVGLGMGGITRRQILVMSTAVLLFHIAMPLAGVYAGELFGAFAGRTASIAGALVLLYLGIKMLYGALKNDELEGPNILLTNTAGIVFLSGSVSLDALSVGFSLGTQNLALGQAVLIMGPVAGLMTVAGFLLGQQVGGWIGEKAVILGGAILIFIGIKLLL